MITWLCWLGALVCLKWAVRLMYSIPGVLGRKRTLGDCALITGATDGIGRAYALGLAKRKMPNIILVGRSQEKLQDVEAEIVKISGGATKSDSIVFDFAGAKSEDYGSIRERLKTLPEVDLLINNVGLSYPSAQYLYELSPAFLDELIDVNLRSTLHMTNIVYGRMRSKNRGTVLCLGSGASVIAEPLLAGYAAVKGAIESFCRSMHAEVNGTNVVIQCQTPLMVVSKMSKVKRSSVLVPTPSQYVAYGVRALLGGGNQSMMLSCHPTVSPWPGHKILLELIDLLPAVLFEKVRLANQKSIRARYLKKMKQR